MAGMGFFDVHRTWEDWITVLLGVLIGFSPWFVGHVTSDAIFWNAVIVGALVVGLALLELIALQYWEEGLELLCGLWLIASPFMFGYGGMLRSWHFVLGAIVALMAAITLVQDWFRSEDELARHGH
jgi:hypothetical protein